MEMLNSIKGTFQLVQDELASSIRSLRLKENNDNNTNVNFDAGLDIVVKNEISFEEMKSINQKNVAIAELIDEKIFKVHEVMNSEYKLLQQLNSFVVGLPDFARNMKKVEAELDSLQNKLQNFEEFLIAFEDLVETEELKQREVEERFKLAAYVENKTIETELLTKTLTDHYSEHLTQYEKKVGENLKERQELFNMAFQQDMQLYKESGMVPVVKSKKLESKVALEDIEIEDDLNGLNELLEN